MGTVYLIFFTLGVFLVVSGNAAFSHAAGIPKRPVRLVGLILAAPYGLSLAVGPFFFVYGILPSSTAYKLGVQASELLLWACLSGAMLMAWRARRTTAQPQAILENATHTAAPQTPPTRPFELPSRTFTNIIGVIAAILASVVGDSAVVSASTTAAFALASVTGHTWECVREPTRLELKARLRAVHTNSGVTVPDPTEDVMVACAVDRYLAFLNTSPCSPRGEGDPSAPNICLGPV